MQMMRLMMEREQPTNVIQLSSSLTKSWKKLFGLIDFPSSLVPWDFDPIKTFFPIVPEKNLEALETSEAYSI